VRRTRHSGIQQAAEELNRHLKRRSVLRYLGVWLGESASNPTIEDSYLELRYRRYIDRVDL
jgi:hypothetical protein